VPRVTFSHTDTLSLMKIWANGGLKYIIYTMPTVRAPRCQSTVLYFTIQRSTIRKVSGCLDLKVSPNLHPNMLASGLRHRVISWLLYELLILENSAIHLKILPSSRPNPEARWHNQNI